MPNASSKNRTGTASSVSITLPPSLFGNLNQSSDTEINLLFGAYKSSSLYPQANQTDENFAVASSVISATVIGLENDIMNLTEDVSIVLKLDSEVC